MENKNNKLTLKDELISIANNLTKIAKSLGDESNDIITEKEKTDYPTAAGLMNLINEASKPIRFDPEIEKIMREFDAEKKEEEENSIPGL